MRKLTLSLSIAPISLNSTYIFLKGRRLPSKQYTKFKKTFFALATPQIGEIRNFFSTFIPERDEIHARLIFYTPNIYTKKNTINQKCCDVDNIFKPISDQVFSFQTKVDDSAITRIEVIKKFSKVEKTILVYEIDDRLNPSESDDALFVPI